MIYNDFKGLKISDLGFSTKRLPVIGGDDSNIDEPQSEEMIDYAISHGINYFDTALSYHEGASSRFLGKVLSKYPRDCFLLANKFPGYDLKNMSRYEEIFEKQLADCRVDYFDFYMLNNVDSLNIEAYLNPENKVISYLLKQKEKGRIRHFGFSTYGSVKTIERFLDKYGDHMEFAQTQLNYVDWTLSTVKDRVEFLRSRKIPIWAMEPLRGGQLAALEDAQEEILKMFRPYESMAGWAFRFVQSTAAVKTIVTGISNLEQLKENIEIFKNDEKLLNGKEAAIIMTISDDIIERSTINCTDCKNCMEFCKYKLNIPHLIKMYNSLQTENSYQIIGRLWSSIPEDRLPSRCVDCGACEKVCPQQINISDIMEDFADKIYSYVNN